MAVTKTDITTNKPTSGQIVQVQSGQIVTAETENANNLLLANSLILLYNYCIDQTPQTTIASSYSALQTYNVDNGVNPDIAVGKITSSFTNGNINVTPNGTGLFQYNGVEVANQSYVNQQIASAATVTGLVMTGATGVANGTSGAVPQPLIANRNQFLRGDATWANAGVGAGTIITANPSPAVVGTFYLCNTTSAAFTVTLPASPTAGDKVYIGDYLGTWNTNQLTVGRNGNNIMGLAEDLICYTRYATYTLLYQNSTVGWLLIQGLV